MRSSALLVCVVLAGCETVPRVRFTVIDAVHGDVIADAIVLLPTGHPATGPSETSERLRDDPSVTTRMHPPIGHDGDGWFAMRTGPDGTGEYSELRLMPWAWFSSPEPIHRAFYVWAADHEPREVSVEIGVKSSAITVPLTQKAAQ